MKMKIVDVPVYMYVYISIHKYGNAVVKLVLSLIRPYSKMTITTAIIHSRASRERKVHKQVPYHL